MSYHGVKRSTIFGKYKLYLSETIKSFSSIILKHCTSYPEVLPSIINNIKRMDLFSFKIWNFSASFVKIISCDFEIFDKYLRNYSVKETILLITINILIKNLFYRLGFFFFFLLLFMTKLKQPPTVFHLDRKNKRYFEESVIKMIHHFTAYNFDVMY